MTTQNENSPLTRNASGQENGTAIEARGLSKEDNGPARGNLSPCECPAPEQASEAVNQQPGKEADQTEVIPTAEGILDACAAGGNGTSSKVSRADALTDHLHILSANEEAMEEAIERFDGSSTGEALKCVLHAQKQLRASLVTPVEQHEAAPATLTAEQVEWIVNDNAELGVKIGNQFFFLYKGHSLAYEETTLDDGSPMHWRPVFKREFGECANPINYKDLSKIGTVSLSDSDQWKQLPQVSAPLEGTGNGADVHATALRIVHEESERTLSQKDFDMCMRMVKGALSRAPRTEVAGAVPEGWKMVPVEATPEILMAIWQNERDARRAWERALEAVPQPPSADAAAAPADESSELEQVVACLGDDAATLHHADQYIEMADNMEAAARLLASRSAISAEDRAADAMCNRWPRQRKASPADERAAFEAKMSVPLANLLGASAASMTLFDDERYDSDLVEAAWLAWQARATASQPAAGRPPESVIKVRVTHLGHHAEVESYVPRALPMGVHELYTAPPAQVATRQGLTDEQRSTLESLARTSTPYEQEVLRSILAAHTGQPEPRAEAMETVRVPARVLDLLNIINRDGVLKRAAELQEVYRLIDAARAGGQS
ncbi:hypothetical protein QZN30_17770 [Burkholderia multivorans]|nr:hypothetical protein [Burkholderia multivorans]